MITNERKKLLDELMGILGYQFKDLELLNLAFVHRSYINEYKDFKKDFHRGILYFRNSGSICLGSYRTSRSSWNSRKSPD